MAMATFVKGKPIMQDYLPSANYSAGDVIVLGGVPFVAHEDNPPYPGAQQVIGINWVKDALAAFGGIYQMAADASYAVPQFVYWDSVLQQVTAQTGANRVPFGFIVGGPADRLDDGGPTGSGILCSVLHQPEPEMRFGGSTFGAGMFSSFNDEGNLYRAVGNPFSQNGADTTDDILGGIVLAPNAFDLSGRGLAITAQGLMGANANTKRVKLWLNPTMVGQTVTNGVISGGTVSGVGSGFLALDTGALTNNANGWSVFLNLFKYGAAGSNTQYSQGSVINGTTHGGITVPGFSTIAENAAINLVITGATSVATAGDVKLNFFEVNAMN